MSVPGDLRYTSEHEWVRVGSGRFVVGITDFAQAAMGDVVHVELPSVGTSVKAGDVVAEIETTKSVSEIYAPISGTIVEINEEIREHSEFVNSDPYGGGWLFSLSSDVPEAPNDLLDAHSYESLVKDLAD